MREFTDAFITEKNKLETYGAWGVLLELEVNANSTAYFTTYADTFTWNSRVYRPVVLKIGTEQVASDGSLPNLNVDCANIGGEAFRFAKDNDLSLNDVVLRLVSTTQTTSGSDARIKLQVTGMAFNDEVAHFNLSLPINTEVFGPKRVFDRSTFKSIPYGFKNYALISHS
jgi:hypothetical protein